MKKQTLTAAAIGMAMAGSLCAQSLYDLAPSDTETDSVPLTYTAGLNIGLDDNPTPLLGGDDASLYGQAYVGASFLNNTPQTTLSVGAQVGVIHYFDQLDVAGQDVDSTNFTASLFLNWTHRVSERLRFVSRNNLAYQLEPDFSTGFQAQRQVGNYFRWMTDNAIGYRWSDRLATYTGVRLSGIAYDDVNGFDRSSFMIYNDFRYQVNDRTVATLTYRRTQTEGDGFVSDSTNQFVLVGLEHRFSTQTTGVLRVGTQIRDVDNGASGSSPYVEGSFRTRVNNKFSLNGYVRYGVEDFQRSLLDTTFTPPVFAVYSGTNTLRLGFDAQYAISNRLSLMGGVNMAFLDYDDLQSVLGQSSLSEELFNAFIGVNVRVSDNLTFNARYNFEDFTSDGGRSYDRNRFSVGVATTF